MPGTVVLNQVPVEVHDDYGNKVEVAVEGNKFLIAIRDEEQMEMLSNIYTQLRKINFYLSQMIDQEINDYDMEEDNG